MIPTSDSFQYWHQLIIFFFFLTSYSSWFLTCVVIFNYILDAMAFILGSSLNLCFHRQSPCLGLVYSPVFWHTSVDLSWQWKFIF